MLEDGYEEVRMSENDGPKCMTTIELAKMLGCSKKSIHTMVADERIPSFCYVMQGHRRKFLPGAVACLHSTGKWPKDEDDQMKWYFQLLEATAKKSEKSRERFAA